MDWHMAHATLKQLRQDFVTHRSNGYGWLEGGSGKKTVVLVHGVTGGKNDMLPLAVKYREQDFHVYCLDLPGHGDSDWVDEPTFERTATWLKEFLDLIGAPDVLVSNSYSSAVAYALTQRGLLPEKTHLILGCPTPDTSRLTKSLYRAGMIIPTRLAWHMYTTLPVQYLRTSVAAKKLGMTSLRWLMESERAKRPTINPIAFETLSVRLFIENPYEGPRIDKATQRRMSVILGTRDNIVTKRTARILRELLPGAKHIAANKAGHILHFESVDDYFA